MAECTNNDMVHGGRDIACPNARLNEERFKGIEDKVATIAARQADLDKEIALTLQKVSFNQDSIEKDIKRIADDNAKANKSIIDAVNSYDARMKLLEQAPAERAFEGWSKIKWTLIAVVITVIATSLVNNIMAILRTVK